MQDLSNIDRTLRVLGANLSESRNSLYCTPSENSMSPLARLPFVMDLYSRYFFDHLNLLGFWTFYGAIDAGELEYGILLPELRSLTGAKYVTVRPLSGLNCLTIAMAALTDPGDVVLTVPLDCGGHLSTPNVAERLGVRCRDIPMSSFHDVDMDALESLLREARPRLIYLDQSTHIFPIDSAPLRAAVDRLGLDTHIHHDTSHINGLVLMGALPNPLERGAHSFGGSTHKTLPGPHKGFLATSSDKAADAFEHFANHFVSHHQPASVLSLAITLFELQECGGRDYARRTLENALVMAGELAGQGLRVGGEGHGWTGCHQVWARPADGVDAHALARDLWRHGLVVNCMPELPGLRGPSYRLSVSELTRFGARAEDIRELSGLLAGAMRTGTVTAKGAKGLARLRERLDRPRYCLDSRELERRGLVPDLVAAVRCLEGLASWSRT